MERGAEICVKARTSVRTADYCLVITHALAGGWQFRSRGQAAAVGDQTGGSFTSTMSRTDSAFPNRDSTYGVSSFILGLCPTPSD